MTGGKLWGWYNMITVHEKTFFFKLKNPPGGGPINKGCCCGKELFFIINQENGYQC